MSRAPSQKLLHFPSRWMRGEESPDDLLGALLFLAASALAAWFMVKFLAPRDDIKPAPLAKRLREGAIGFALGAGQLSFDVLMMALFGVYTVVAVHGLQPLFLGFIVMTGVALVEEGAIRAVMLPRIERLLGPWWALFLTSALFGAAHLGNPNASAMAAVAIGLEAGAALGGLYLLTRRLWAPVAMHLAWNWMCGPVLGVPVSGTAPPSLLQPRIEGPDWLTGGGFGVEASVIELFAGTLMATVILWLLYKQRQSAISRPAHSMSVTPAS
ncbi:CPBP family intramembrane glutamic endopeptidase [Roseiterribacter gracilis]|uniref:CPBP family intramembrane glutamic endopeptidase n=1 Tax=Roseiterribacter gracilis TaxID=2812848 RepID=UPI003B431D7F